MMMAEFGQVKDQLRATDAKVEQLVAEASEAKKERHGMATHIRRLEARLNIGPEPNGAMATCIHDEPTRVFLFGGETSEGRPTDSVNVFNLKTKAWKSGIRLLGEGTFGHSSVAVGGKILVMGGWDRLDRNYATWMEAFDMSANKWNDVENYGTAVIENLVYVCGGGTPSGILSACEVFDSDKETWTLVSPMKNARGFHKLVELKGYLYAIGGEDGVNVLSSVERYDPEENRWTCVAPTNTKRSGYAAAVLNGRIYVAGGWDGKEWLNSVEQYDVEPDAWEFVAPMQQRRRRFEMIAANGHLMAFGGTSSADGTELGSETLASVEVYCPELDAWKLMTEYEMPEAKHNFSIAVC